MSDDLEFSAGLDASGVKDGIDDVISSLEDLRDEVAAAVGELADVQFGRDAISKDFDEALKEIQLAPAKAGAEFRALTDSVEKLGGTMNLTGKQAEFVAQEIERLAAAGASIPKDALDWANGINSPQPQPSGGIDLLAQMQALQNIQQIAGPVTSALQDMASGMIETADQLTNLSARTQISIEDLQRFEYIGSTVGVGVGEFQAAVRRLNTSLDSASTTTLGHLRAMGLSLEDLAKKSQGDKLRAIIQGLQGIQDESKRGAAAVALLGRSGLSLAALGSDFDKLDKEAKAMGLLTDDAVNRADNLGDELGKLGLVFKTFKDEAVSNFTSMDAVVQPIIKIRETFGDLQSSLQNASPGMKQFVGAVVGAGVALGGTLNFLVEWGTKIGLLTVAMEALGVTWAAVGSALLASGGLIFALGAVVALMLKINDLSENANQTSFFTSAMGFYGGGKLSYNSKGQLGYNAAADEQQAKLGGNQAGKGPTSAAAEDTDKLAAAHAKLAQSAAQSAQALAAHTGRLVDQLAAVRASNAAKLSQLDVDQKNAEGLRPVERGLEMQRIAAERAALAYKEMDARSQFISQQLGSDVDGVSKAMLGLADAVEAAGGAAALTEPQLQAAYQKYVQLIDQGVKETPAAVQQAVQAWAALSKASQDYMNSFGREGVKLKIQLDGTALDGQLNDLGVKLADKVKEIGEKYKGDALAGYRADLEKLAVQNSAMEAVLAKHQARLSQVGETYLDVKGKANALTQAFEEDGTKVNYLTDDALKNLVAKLAEYQSMGQLSAAQTKVLDDAMKELGERMKALDFDKLAGKSNAQIKELAEAGGPIGKIAQEWLKVHEHVDIVTADVQTFAAKATSALDNFASLLGSISGLFEAIGVSAESGLGKAVSALSGTAQSASNFIKTLADPKANIVDKIGAGIALAGSVIKGIKSLFGGEPEWKKVGREAGKALGVGLDEESSKAIMDLSKKLGISVKDAALLSVNEIASKTGRAISSFTPQLLGLMTSVANGAVPAAKGVEELGKAFSSLQEEAAKGSIEAKRSMVALIMQSEQQKVRIGEVISYVKDATTAGVAGLADVYKYLGTQADVSEQRLAYFGASAAAMFAKLRAQGVGWVEAFKLVQPAIDAAREAYEKLGKELPPTLAALASFGDKVTAHQDLINMIDGATAALKALGDTGAITADLFNSAMGDIAQQQKDLADAGFDSTESLHILAPELMQIRDLAAQYGFAIDDATQALINQAEAAGEFDKLKTPQEQLVDGMHDMVGLLGLLVQKMGVELPAAIQESIKEWQNFNSTAKGTPGAPGAPSGPPSTKPSSNEGYAHGGVVKQPKSGGWTWTHGDELVFPLDPGVNPTASAMDALSGLVGTQGGVAGSGGVGVGFSPTIMVGKGSEEELTDQAIGQLVKAVRENRKNVRDAIRRSLEKAGR